MIGTDNVTAGSWEGKYGELGYSLWNLNCSDGSISPSSKSTTGRISSTSMPRSAVLKGPLCFINGTWSGYHRGSKRPGPPITVKQEVGSSTFTASAAGDWTGATGNLSSDGRISYYIPKYDQLENGAIPENLHCDRINWDDGDYWCRSG